MDHNEVEQFDLVDLYLLGRLTAEQTAAFEEHFVDCRHCLESLKMTESFLRGLRAASAREVSRSGVPALAGFASSLSRFFSGYRMILTGAGLILIVAVVSVGALALIGRLRSEAERAKVMAAQFERQFNQQEASAAKSEAESKAREEELNRKIRQLEVAQAQVRVGARGGTPTDHRQS